MIKAVIDEAVIVESVAATEKSALLREVVEALVAADAVAAGDVDGLCKRLEEREAHGSTGIGKGIAVPHVKSASPGGIRLAVARVPHEIDYQAIDGQKVHTVFLLVGREDQPEEHLAVLRWISGLARNADFRRFVQGAAGAVAIRELLHEMTA
ncbi:MAG: PTS sugar transporter subunit IIA [Planctomycetota bacterium]